MSPLVEKARDYALKLHRFQQYGVGDRSVPYAHHLATVVGNLLRFGYYDEHTLAAAWLHDAIEDTRASKASVGKHTNNEVAVIVDAVTSVHGNRKERFETMLKGLRWYAAQEHHEHPERPLVLKLADRIANVETTILTGDSRLGMYVREHHALYTYALAARNETATEMIDHLEDIIHPFTR